MRTRPMSRIPAHYSPSAPIPSERVSLAFSHQPWESHPSRLHHVQPTRTGLTWRLSAMWRVLGTIAPTSLHVAQIHHLIWRTLNVGTSRHTGRHGERACLYLPLPSPEPIERSLSFAGHSGRKAVAGPAPQICRACTGTCAAARP